MLATDVPFPIYFDKAGKPLDSGSIYFGTVNGNPETSPITVYWDTAKTQPVAQPVKTIAGYPVRAGTVTNIYSPTDYSTTVRDKDGSLVFYAPTSASFSTSAGTVSILDYGASTGAADNYTAVMAAYNAVSAGATIRVPAGVYNFLTPPVFGSKRVAWLGEGARQSVWNYAGASTTTDCFTFGDGVSSVNGSRISGIGFSSSTVMTAGAGVHLKGFTRSALNDIYFDHQDGNGNFWHAAWFDGFDFVTLDGFQARAQKDGIRYNGTTLGKADLFMRGGKVEQCTVGLHAGGDAGGVAVDTVDIISNATNVLIDKAITGNPNREHFFSSTVALDTADTTRTGATPNGICLDIQDTGGIIFLDGTWVATAGTLIRFGSTFGGTFVQNGGVLTNALTTYGGDGNAIEIGGTGGLFVINGPLMSTVQGTGVICTAGGPNNNVSLRITNASGVATLTSNVNSGAGVDALMGRIVGGGAQPFASAVDGTPAQTFYQNATGGGGAMAIGYFAANASPGWIDFCKSRGTTNGSHAVVQTSDNLGGVNFAGSDGTSFVSAAHITAIVRGTPASGDVSARLAFGTAAPGSKVVSDRHYITEFGHLIPTATTAFDLGAAATAYYRTVYAQNIVLLLPASATPANNGEMTAQLTSNTSLTFKVKGSDGVVRSGSIALA